MPKRVLDVHCSTISSNHSLRLSTFEDRGAKLGAVVANGGIYAPQDGSCLEMRRLGIMPYVGAFGSYKLCSNSYTAELLTLTSAYHLIVACGLLATSAGYEMFQKSLQGLCQSPYRGAPARMRSRASRIMPPPTKNVLPNDYKSRSVCDFV
ncbi:hypothetical protein CPC08DRAFT_131303 [Agrocybe pediades]|nr:hypothetical protein CPC08DRAFT_131303 [Agrocybe pediades]